MKLIRRRKLRENQYFGAVAELSPEKEGVLAALAKELVGVKNQNVKNLLGTFLFNLIRLTDPVNGVVPAPDPLNFALGGMGRKGTGQDQTDILREIEKILLNKDDPAYKEVPPELFSGIDLPTGENFEEFGLSLITIAKTMEDRLINYMRHGKLEERLLKEMIKREIKKLLRR